MVDRWKLPLVILSLLTVLACGAGDEAAANSPEETFLRMQASVAEGRYDDVWSLLSTEARRQWTKGISRFKEIVGKSTVNRKEHERLLVQDYGTTIDEFVAMPAEKLYARHLWKRAPQVARLRIAGEVVHDGDRAYLPITKQMDRGVYPTIRLPFLMRSGRWLIADNPIGSVNQLLNPAGTGLR